MNNQFKEKAILLEIQKLGYDAEGLVIITLEDPTLTYYMIKIRILDKITYCRSLLRTNLENVVEYIIGDIEIHFKLFIKSQMNSKYKKNFLESQEANKISFVERK